MLKIYGKMKVLYLEDEKEDFEKIRKKLENYDIELVWISNPIKAIEYLKNNKVDAVFVDLELKDAQGKLLEIQGEDFVKKVNRIFPDLPVFILSKYFGKTISYLGCYSKGDILKRDADKLLIHQLEEILKEKDIDFIPSKQWKRKWGKKWEILRKSSDFERIIKKVEVEAEKDIDLLEKGELKESYRAYRTTKTLFDVLVSRRVLTYSYLKFYKKPGIVWWYLEEFLNMEENAIKNFFFEVGLAWGSILNGKTLLREEREWLEKVKKNKNL